MDPKLLSIVVPVFNEEEVLRRMYQELAVVMGALPERSELIFVNDGSTDRTCGLLAELHQQDERVKVINFSRNFGHQTAVSAGIQYARGDCVAVMDADLQDPPSHLEVMLERWREGYDVVYAVRRKRKEALWKRTSYAFFYRLLQTIAAIDLPLNAGDFCVMDRRVAQVLREIPERHRFVRGLRSWAGFRQIGAEYDRPIRAGGCTKYGLSKLVRLAMDGILGFSVTPLRAISVVGLVVALLAFATIPFYAIWRFTGFRLLGHRPQDVLGFFTLLCLILFLSGVQLLALGAIGEYLGQVVVESKRRPLWVVESTLGFTDPPSRLGGTNGDPAPVQ
jgi:polyisoprenyl-phosphate glycosyltransferase